MLPFDDLIEKQEVVRILCDLAAELPQTASERTLTRDDTPGLTGIGERYFCENVETATETIEQLILDTLVPRRIGREKT